MAQRVWSQIGHIVVNLYLYLAFSYHVIAHDPGSFWDEEVPTFQLIPHTTPKFDVNNRCNSYLDYIQIVLLTTAFMIALWCVHHYMKWKGNSGMYFLRISSARGTINVPLFKVPSAFNVIHFSAFGPWDSMSVKGTFKPNLVWNNDCINVKHMETGAMIELPSKIALSMFAGLKLRRILRENYVIYITCIHDELAYYINFCSKDSSICKTCFRDETP